MTTNRKLALCERLGSAFEKFLKCACPCVYCLLFSATDQYRPFKAVAGFLYGLFLGIVFYELILTDLQLTSIACLVIGAIISLMLALGNALSIQVRCISALTVPSFLGRAGRGVLKAVVLAYVIAGPVQNLVGNGREVVRVFACCTSLTYNLTKTRTDLMFKPFQEAILNIKPDTSEVKETFHSIRDVLLPIAEEIEGEDELARLREDNDYIDQLQNDTLRSEEIAKKYARPAKEKRDETEGERYEREFKMKQELRCEEMISKGTAKCRGMFDSAYDKCYERVSFMAAWLLCWPMKLTFVCNLIGVLGGEDACDPGDQIEPGFGEAYASLKHSEDRLVGEFQQIKVQYELPRITPPLDVRDATDTARSVLNEFQQKRAVLDLFLLVVKRLLAFVFIKIILGAQTYHDKYLTDIEFDNAFVTRYFRKIDARRKRRAASSILPLKKVERSAMVDPCAPLPAASERTNLVGQAVKLVMELATVITILTTDRMFYDALDLVRRHAHVDYTQEGLHEMTMTVKGSGLIANLVRSIVGGFNVKKKVRNVQSNRACLPKPHKLDNYYMRKIFLTYMFVGFLVLGDAYTQRLRRAICAYFYPKREKRRVLFLYNETLKRRRGMLKFMIGQVQGKVREHRLSLDAGMFLALRLRYPGACAWLRLFGSARRKCLLCGETEPRKARARPSIGCQNPACHFYHCAECWRDVRGVCYACATPPNDADSDAEGR